MIEAVLSYIFVVTALEDCWPRISVRPEILNPENPTAVDSVNQLSVRAALKNV